VPKTSPSHANVSLIDISDDDEPVPKVNPQSLNRPNQKQTPPKKRKRVVKERKPNTGDGVIINLDDQGWLKVIYKIELLVKNRRNFIKKKLLGTFPGKFDRK